MLFAVTHVKGQMTGDMRNETENRDTNPLLCDLNTGMCGPAGEDTVMSGKRPVPKASKIRIIYFTDPICSSCWGIEPQLKKMKLAYGDNIEIEYRMGGLLKDWSYNSGGISAPTDVAPHWEEASAYYGMPIDGDVWLEDPLSSSFPPSIAFKAAQVQDPEKAIAFLRAMRERLFLEKVNIARWENLEPIAKQVGLDTYKLKQDMEGQGLSDFQKDLELAREMGVRGFPTLFFVHPQGGEAKLYGSKPYKDFEAALKYLLPGVEASKGAGTLQELMDVYPSLTLKEYAVISGNDQETALRQLDDFVRQGKALRQDSKNGPIWRRARP